MFQGSPSKTACGQVMFRSFRFARFDQLHVSKSGFAPIIFTEKGMKVLRRSRHENRVHKNYCVIHSKLVSGILHFVPGFVQVDFFCFLRWCQVDYI